MHEYMFHKGDVVHWLTRNIGGGRIRLPTIYDQHYQLFHGGPIIVIQFIHGAALM